MLHIRLLIYFLCLIAFGCSKPIEGDLAIVNVNIINVQNGNVESNKDIVIRDDRIQIILEHKENQNYKVDQVIDGTGQYVIPGLWDMHTHTWFNYEHSFPLLLANGVTGIRDMFGHVEPYLNLKDQISNGEILGPDIYFSGPIIEGANGRKFSLTYDTPKNPTQAKEIVNRQKNEGADFIKVYSALEYDSYMAIAEESKLASIPLTGHIPNQVRIEEAVNAGQRSIEHLYGLVEHCSSQNAYYFDVLKGIKTDTILTGKDGHSNRMKFVTNTFDERKISSLVEILKGKNVWICPTLIVNKNYLRVPNPEIHKDEKIHFLPSYMTSPWDQRGSEKLENRINSGYFDVLKRYHQLNLLIIKSLNENGINFLAGSDYVNPYCIPGFSLHDELRIFVEEAGFSNLEALQTATINPARYLGKDKEYGSVDEGKIANLLLLSANPIKNINNSRSITGVLQRGEYFSSTELQSKIQTIANENKLPNIWEHIKPIIDESGFHEASKVYDELKTNNKDKFNFNREQLIDLGYTLLDEGETEVAIKVFEWNTELFPEYWSAFDCLGDGYSIAGDKKEAVEAWKKAIKLGSIITLSKIKEIETGN